METLEDRVRRLSDRYGSLWSALREVYRDYMEGRIVLVDPSPPRGFREYMLRLDYTLWFWISLLIVALSITTIILRTGILAPLRYLLGTIYILFMPGYALVEALYPREGDLRPVERVALSIGLSLAIIPLIGLALNYTPWGISLSTIIPSTSAYTVAMLLTAAYRKYRVLAAAHHVQ